jgi:hypothetical protein
MAVLHPVAYGVYFALRRRGVSVPIGALEGLYWSHSDQPLPIETSPGSLLQPEDWHWRLLLPVPEEGTQEEIRSVVEDVRVNKAPAALDRLRVEMLAEGRSAQILHLGPYDAETATGPASIDQARAGAEGAVR